MKLKDDSVNIWALQLQMQPVLKGADQIWLKYGKELVITSARDGIHSAGSLHYYGFAVDLRTHYFDEDTKRKVATELKMRLGADYDIITHSTHIHAEYDPKFHKA